jgi:GNAT superfamily N-acetyltransferase
MGAAYVRSFYRYVASSDREILVAERGAEGHPVAAAVLSLEPATLNRRLLLRTPLLMSALGRLPRMLPLLRGAVRGRSVELPAVLPQLILIFTAASERGKGRASALIGELERRLRQHGIPRYEVRTESDPANPALEFYRRRGFEVAGLSVRFGTPFQIFTRAIETRQST